MILVHKLMDYKTSFLLLYVPLHDNKELEIIERIEIFCIIQRKKTLRPIEINLA